MPVSAESVRSAAARYRALLVKIDSFVLRLRRTHPASILCRPGCDACCILSSVFPVEAESLSRALRRLPLRTLRSLAANGTDSGACPLLHKGRCAVYKARPVICRTHGYPLLTERGVDFCRLNFKGVRTFDSRSVLDLNALNTLLAAVNIVFLKETGAAGLRSSRIALKVLLSQTIRQRLPENKRK